MDLLHVDDAVDGVLQAIRRLQNGEQAGLEEFNLVEGKRKWSEEEIVELVRTHTRSFSPLRDIGDHLTNIGTSEYSNEKAKSQLLWEPKVDLLNGLSRAIGDLTDSIATYSRSYLSSNCAPSSASPYSDTNIPVFPEDERNKALNKLKDCTVNLGFDHAGWIHHVKCEDGRHCTADGNKVPSYNWNQTVFIIREVPSHQVNRERTVRVMFEEEQGMGFLGVSDSALQKGGEIGFELFKEDDEGEQSHVVFDLEVRIPMNYQR